MIRTNKEGDEVLTHTGGVKALSEREIMKDGNPTICYKNLTPEDASRIVYNYFIEDDPCLDLAIGTLERKEGDIPYIPELERFEKEERIILRYAGAIDPEEIRETMP